MLRALLLSLAFCATIPAAAQMTPPRGSPLRAQLMDTLRPTVMAEIGGPIEFVVTYLRVMGQWTYAYVRPQRPGGIPIDWNRTNDLGAIMVVGVGGAGYFLKRRDPPTRRRSAV